MRAPSGNKADFEEKKVHVQRFPFLTQKIWRPDYPGRTRRDETSTPAMTLTVDIPIMSTRIGCC